MVGFGCVLWGGVAGGFCVWKMLFIKLILYVRFG